MKEIDNKIDHTESVIKAISQLTDRQKIAVLAAMLGYTQAEIGRLLGVNQPAASELLKRARGVMGY